MIYLEMHGEDAFWAILNLFGRLLVGWRYALVDILVNLCLIYLFYGFPKKGHTAKWTYLNLLAGVVEKKKIFKSLFSVLNSL